MRPAPDARAPDGEVARTPRRSGGPARSGPERVGGKGGGAPGAEPPGARGFSGERSVAGAGRPAPGDPARDPRDSAGVGGTSGGAAGGPARGPGRRNPGFKQEGAPELRVSDLSAGAGVGDQERARAPVQTWPPHPQPAV